MPTAVLTMSMPSLGKGSTNDRDGQVGRCGVTVAAAKVDAAAEAAPHLVRVPRHPLAPAPATRAAGPTRPPPRRTSVRRGKLPGILQAASLQRVAAERRPRSS